MTFYLVYLSSARQLYTTSDLSDILKKSRLNNTNRNITGLLLYHDGSILQILEGDEESVMDVYHKIEQDDRHYNVLQLVTGTSEERNFPDWSMGFKTVTDEEWSEISGYLKLDPSTILTKIKNSNRKIGTLVSSYMSVSIR